LLPAITSNHSVGISGIDFKVLFYIKSVTMDRLSIPGLQRQSTVRRLSGIVKQHLDAFTSDLSQREAALLRSLPPEEANAMFVVWLCDSLGVYRTEREKTRCRIAGMEEHIEQLRLALNDSENERKALLQLLKDKEDINRSLHTGYLALMKDVEKARKATP
jgi:hypothetical protein